MRRRRWGSTRIKLTRAAVIISLIIIYGFVLFYLIQYSRPSSKDGHICPDCLQKTSLKDGMCKHGFQCHTFIACNLVCHNGGMLDKKRCKCNCKKPYAGPSCSYKQPIRVCLATNEFRGIDSHGGIGAALFRLSKLLIRAGYNVTVAYASHPECVGISCNWAQWKTKYSKMGIQFVPLYDTIMYGKIESFMEPKRSYKTYLWLKKHEDEFDIIHFHDYLGLGYFSTMAKKLGLAFQNVVLSVQLHGTSWFVNRAQNRYPYGIDHLVMKFLEEKSIKYADSLISPSKFYLDWLVKSGLDFQDRSVILQNIMLEDSIHMKRTKHKTRKDIKNLVFFGRFAKVKGLDVFIKAMDILSNNEIVTNRISKVTFLGNPEGSSIDGLSVARYFQSKAAKWKFRHQVITGKDTTWCLEFLSNPDTLPIIPSLIETSSYVVMELLHNKIPFLASNRGGIPELVDPRFHSTNLFEPNAHTLAEKIVSSLNNGVPTPLSKVDLETVHKQWITWHETAFLSYSPESLWSETMPTIQVTVIVVTYDIKAPSLKATLNSLRHQTYKSFNVLLVSAGPLLTTYETTEIKREFHDLNLGVIQSKDSYNIGSARNQAAKVASGKYLIFLNCDDIAKPNMLEIFVQSAEYSGFEAISDFTDSISGITEESVRHLNNENFQIFLNDLNKRKYDKRIIHIGDAVETGIFTNIFGSQNLFITKMLFNEIGGYPDTSSSDLHGFRLGGCEDWALYAKLTLSRKPIGIIPTGLIWRVTYINSENVKQKRMSQIFFDKEKCEAYINQIYLQHIPTHLHGWILYGMGRHHLVK